MFKQKIYKFNIIHIDGFNIAVEFVRRDLQGQKCKPDNKASISNLYIHDVDVDAFQDKRIVVCDPGKRDLLYIGRKKTDEELAMVPEHETEQQRNSRVMNQDKKYKWLRMTQMSWSWKSRMNEKQKRWAMKYTEVDYDRNQMIESNENALNYPHFSNFVVAKLRQVFLTIDFYSLDLSSIHKMQAFIHKQKTESWLLKNLVQQFGNPKDILIQMGDYGKQGSKNLKHQRPTRGIGWIQFLKRNRFEVLMINEAFTSAKCPVCFEKVATFLRVTNPRCYKRENTPVTTCHGLLACNSESCKFSNKGSTKLFDRNKLACLNMIAIAEARMSGNEMPQYLCSK
ncbi:hypothetical protein P9112_004470 [Eukaryota sp. TZLM1-RC]